MKARAQALLATLPKPVFDLDEVPGMSPNTVRNHAKRQVNPLRLTKIGRRTVLLAIDLAEFLAAQPAKEGTDEAFSKRANENWRKRRAHATTETTTEAVTA